MSSQPYTKHPVAYVDQLQQLKDRGLLIPDDSKALHLLENISYYRLSGYWYPLLSDKVNHRFKPDASIDNAFNMYCFDRELRNLVMSELEKIEIAVRSKMIYILSHAYGAFWFNDNNLFQDQQMYSDTLKAIKNEYRRSDQEFILAFKAKYQEPLPPAWILLEITTFGTISKLFDNLNPGKHKKEIANYFGLADAVFVSWLHSLAYLINTCAHHSRLWNRDLQIKPQMPRSPKKLWIKILMSVIV